tara:strand:- start:313 stop:672 length:360 start_codon:yes stop_codon:yes gene_type:complete
MSLTDSPCIDYCVYNYEEDCCEGCGRNLLEISDWNNYSDEKKALVIGMSMNRLESIKMIDFEGKVTSTLKIIEEGSLSEARAAWMKIIADRPVGLEVMKRMSPKTSQKLTEAIRTPESK